MTNEFDVIVVAPNTTGASDTFMAGLLLAFNRAEPLEQVAIFASAAAAASLQPFG